MQLWRGIAQQTSGQHNPRGRQQLPNGIDCLPWGTHLLPESYYWFRVYLWKIYQSFKQTPQCEAKSFSQKWPPWGHFFWPRKNSSWPINYIQLWETIQVCWIVCVWLHLLPGRYPKLNNINVRLCYCFGVTQGCSVAKNLVQFLFRQQKASKPNQRVQTQWLPRRLMWAKQMYVFHRESMYHTC